MKRRSDTSICPSFGIFTPETCFPDLPCEPPKGKLVLERLYGVMGIQGNNQTSVSSGGWIVASELINLWTKGDGGIPLMSKKMVYSKIMTLYEEFKFVKRVSWKYRSSYAEKVFFTTAICK